MHLTPGTYASTRDPADACALSAVALAQHARQTISWITRCCTWAPGSSGVELALLNHMLQGSLSLIALRCTALVPPCFLPPALAPVAPRPLHLLSPCPLLPNHSASSQPPTYAPVQEPATARALPASRTENEAKMAPLATYL